MKTKDYFTTYVWTVEQTGIVNIIRMKYLNFEKKFFKSGNESSFQIRTIENFDDSMKWSIIEANVLFFRKKQYVPIAMPAANFTLFKENINKCVCVFSACQELVDNAEIKAMLADLGYEFKADSERQTLDKQAFDYYTSLMQNIPILKDYTDGWDEELIEEEFETDKDISQAYLAIKQQNDTVKFCSVLFSVWGVLISKILKWSELLQAGYFGKNITKSLFLIKSEDNANISKVIENTEKQMKFIRMLPDIQTSVAEDIAGYSFERFIPVIHDFTRLQTNQSSLNYQLQENSLTYYSAENLKAPLCIKYLVKDDNLVFRYSYNKVIFKNLNVEKVHMAFMNIMKRCINKDALSPEVFTNISVPAESNQNELRRLNQLKVAMDSIKILHCLKDEEKNKLLDYANIMIAELEDKLVLPNEPINKVGFLLSGKVSAERIDKDSCVKPLFLLKSGSMIGLEGMLESRTSKDLYSVTSDKAYILYIRVGAFKTICNAHPEIYQSILQSYEDRLEKFKKLWLLS